MEPGPRAGFLHAGHGVEGAADSSRGNVVEDQAEILRLARTQGSGSDGFDIYVGITRTDQADGYLFHLRGFA